MVPSIDRQAEPHEAAQAVRIGALQVERREILEVGHHAADHERGKHRLAAEHAGERYDGRAMSEGEWHTGSLNCPS